MQCKSQLLAAWWLFLLLSVASASDLRIVEAAKNQDKDGVRALLTRHADVNAEQGDGATALHWAAHWDDLEMAAALLRAGAKVNATNELGVTPLYLACSNGNAAMAESLLAAGANPNMTAATGVSPLMNAAASGSVDAVKALLARGANPNAKESAKGQTALMWATAERHPDVVRELINHGADVHARSKSNGSLVFVAREGNQALDDRGLSKTIETGGSTPLLFAAQQGDVESGKLLLRAGVSPNETDASGNSALVIAAHSGQAAFAVFLLDNAADPNAAGTGYTALHAAVLRGKADLVKALLAHGADPNARIANGTPIRRYGPDYALTGSQVGATAFWMAAKYASVDMLAALAAGGADPKLATDEGVTPLMAAVTATARTAGVRGAARVDDAHILETSKAVLDLGGSVNSANQAGDTALHIAASRGHTALVQLLVERGAEVNAKNKRGQTPLALAMVRFKATADILRKLGATEPISANADRPDRTE